jgi:hypothetical protein
LTSVVTALEEMSGARDEDGRGNAWENTAAAAAAEAEGDDDDEVVVVAVDVDVDDELELDVGADDDVVAAGDAVTAGARRSRWSLLGWSWTLRCKRLATWMSSVTSERICCERFSSVWGVVEDSKAWAKR